MSFIPVHMSNRLRGFILGLAVLMVSLFLFKFLTREAPPQVPKVVQTIKPVRWLEVQNGPVAYALPVTGRLQALNRIELFAEVQGILKGSGTDFRAGKEYKAGQVLVDIDDSEAQASTLAQRSSYLNTLTQVLPDLKIDYPEDYPVWEDYLERLDPTRNTPPPPSTENKKLKLFLTSRGVISGYYSLKSAENRLAKYRISAPFHGVLSQALVSPGTLVRPGQKLGEFIGDGVYEMEASLALADVASLAVGAPVALHSPDLPGKWTGRVVRINERVDPATQTVLAYIQVSGEGLRDGMYMKASLGQLEIADAIQIDRKILVGTNEVFVIEQDSTISRLQIELVRVTPEFVIVRGLQNGVRIMNENFPGASSGMKVIPRNP